MSRAKPLASGRTEAQVLAQVVEAAAMLGITLERQNTGAALNPRGQLVCFGSLGDSDLRGQVDRGPWRGALIHVEVKKEGFDPRRLRGAKKEHFDRQLARLRETNARGGIGLWVRDAADFLAAMRKVLTGCRVEIDAEGFPWVTDEPPPGGGRGEG